MSTIKALFPGAAITLLISALLCGAGSRGGVFALERTELLDFNLYWSWPLFLVTFGLARAVVDAGELNSNGQAKDRIAASAKRSPIDSSRASAAASRLR